MSLVLSTVFLAAVAVLATVHPAQTRESRGQDRSVEVVGTGVHHFSTARIHSATPTDDGVLVQRSTDTVTLDGDLAGTVLYHSTARIDEANGTAVVTGAQVFSGTVLDGAPTLLFDDRFRFDIDLRTGATRGEVHFEPSKDARHEPRVWCDLIVTGTGSTPEGDSTFDYRGTCRTR